ncbi:hypothetical protein [Oerskovia jenensis]|uniref:hypothetical protein n=1 Tax=Oerskovia jenensis TaxID=162169 RepID=UPI0036D78AF4
MPIDFNDVTTPDRFLTGLAFMSARQRFEAAESMIGSGFGGTVLGSLCRSVFFDGLRWLWVSADPGTRRRALLGDLVLERNRMCRTLVPPDSSCGNLQRWLQPVPPLSDLTGESMTWLDAPTFPSEKALLDDYLTGSPADPSSASARSAALLDVAGLRGAVYVLAHAGHGNYLGLQSTVSDDGVPGHDLRADHEALFMHVASAGVVATLLGSSAALPDLWPADVEQDPFIDEAVRLASVVAAAARPIHKLSTTKKFNVPVKAADPVPPTGLIDPRVVVASEDWWPDTNSIQEVAERAEAYWDLARSFPVDMWAHGNPALHEALNFAGAHSNLSVVLSTYDRPGSEVIAVFAARMLLEESARLRWRFASAEADAFKARATQYFDEMRARAAKTVDLLAGNGVPRADAVSILTLPQNGTYIANPQTVAKRRTPIPTITSMLRDYGRGFPEERWFEVAYSFLSQTVHATPVGYLHGIRYTSEGWDAYSMSPEMLGLALDVACWASAHMIGHSSVIFSNISAESIAFRNELTETAYRVHEAARLVHGLD